MPKPKAYLKKHVWLLISRDKQSGVIRKQLSPQPEGWAPSGFVKVSPQDYHAASTSAMGWVNSENRKWLELLDASTIYMQPGPEMDYHLEPHSAERLRRLLGPYARVMMKMWETE
jgi:hypothetical protein